MNSHLFSTGANASVSETTLLYSTYFGSSSNDDVWGVELDENGCIVIAGTTNGDNLTVKNAIQQEFGGGSSDAFVSKFSSDGQSLVFSTYPINLMRYYHL